ncbi:universal stress protein [Panacibacter ginsenosidivorans]|uniref:Universal stress protein n=1 Tax=Panacibacter ginsenosidivorans TaxID=1813871 RepID=A0A5B8V9X4_9BACT|nr:universal stress protein [Panacibacter ginsenosidivorans]QEC68059.1 universal stress protein [Panacibacter ginsenosidivorans]
MNTILVPTDFSPAARNAAMYAINFAKQVKCKKIIFYNAYQTPIVTDANMAIVDAIDIEEMKKASEENLTAFKLTLKAFCDKNMELETLSEYGVLTMDINEVCTNNNIDLIVMGVTGTGKIAENLIGSFAIDVSRKATVPVIIVPPDAGYTDIKEIMLACDFSQVVETTPVDPIKRILNETSAKLFVVNIDHRQKHFTADTPFESLMLDTLLQGYNPEYHFIDDADFVQAINKFALEKEVDLIITIPKKMGWFDALFHKSHTKALAFHSHVPLMVVH